MPGWRNWQTQWIQNPSIARSCGFNSHLGHIQINNPLKVYLFGFSKELKPGAKHEFSPKVKGECCEGRPGGNFRQEIYRREVPPWAQK